MSDPAFKAASSACRAAAAPTAWSLSSAKAALICCTFSAVIAVPPITPRKLYPAAWWCLQPRPRVASARYHWNGCRERSAIRLRQRTHLRFSISPRTPAVFSSARCCAALTPSPTRSPTVLKFSCAAFAILEALSLPFLRKLPKPAWRTPPNHAVVRVSSREAARDGTSILPAGSALQIAK